MEFEGSLRDARNRAKVKEGRGLKMSIKSLYLRSQTILDQLVAKGAPLECDVRSMLMTGLFEACATLLALGGMVFLLELSFRSFLPIDFFSVWWQRTVSSIFALATVLGFHFVLKKDGRGGINVSPRLPRTTVISIITGFVLLGIIRGLIVGNLDSESQDIKVFETLAKWLGVCAFILLGVSLDLASGLAGCAAWAKLEYAIPILRLYREKAAILADISIAESKLAELELEVDLSMDEVKDSALVVDAGNALA